MLFMSMDQFQSILDDCVDLPTHNNNKNNKNKKNTWSLVSAAKSVHFAVNPFLHIDFAPTWGAPHTPMLSFFCQRFSMKETTCFSSAQPSCWCWKLAMDIFGFTSCSRSDQIIHCCFTKHENQSNFQKCLHCAPHNASTKTSTMSACVANNSGGRTSHGEWGLALTADEGSWRKQNREETQNTRWHCQPTNCVQTMVSSMQLHLSPPLFSCQLPFWMHMVHAVETGSIKLWHCCSMLRSQKPKWKPQASNSTCTTRVHCMFQQKQRRWNITVLGLKRISNLG